MLSARRNDSILSQSDSTEGVSDGMNPHEVFQNEAYGSAMRVLRSGLRVSCGSAGLGSVVFDSTFGLTTDPRACTGGRLSCSSVG